MPLLSQEHRMAIVVLHKEGLSQPAIVNRLREQYGRNVAQSTVSYTLKRYNETAMVSDRVRTGRKSVLSERGARAVRRIALTNRRDSLRTVAGSAGELLGEKISRNLVGRTLKKFGLARRVAAKKPVLTCSQRRKRRDWCQKRVKWPIAQWSRILWSDEKIFRVTNNKRVEFVTRSSREKYHAACISGAPKSGPQIHVWGLIGYNGVAPLKLVNGNLNARKYQEEILPGLEEIGPNLAAGNRKWIFMQDSAPPHAANSTRQYLAARQIQVLDWPGNSPDLNPIENLWAKVQRSLPRNLPRNEGELWTRVQTAWAEVSVEYLRTLISSMPTRVREVIKNHGGHTRF